MINSKQPNTHTRTCGEQRKNPSCICMHWYTYRRTLSLSAAFTTAILWPPPPPSRTAPQSYIHSFIHRSVFFFSSRSHCHAPLLLFCLLSVCLSACLFLASSIRVFSFLLLFFFLWTIFYTRTRYTSSLVLQENRNQEPTTIRNVRMRENVCVCACVSIKLEFACH